MPNNIDSNDRLKQKYLKHRPHILFVDDVSNPGHCSDVISRGIRRQGDEPDRLSLSSDDVNTLRTRSFKLFKRPFPGFLTILTL